MNEQTIVKKCDHFGIRETPPSDAPCWTCLGFVECKLKAGIPVIQDDIDMVEKLERGNNICYTVRRKTIILHF